MNEVSSRRYKYEDYEDWAHEEEEYDLSKWYKDNAGYREAAGVGDVDYKERVEKAGAPLRGPQKRPEETIEAPDLISAVRKAVHVAARVAPDMTHNSAAYEKMRIPSCPTGGAMTNWVYSLGIVAVVSGCYGDELEVTWLRECWHKTFDAFESSDLYVTEGPVRWNRLDCSLSKALQGMMKSSGNIF